MTLDDSAFATIADRTLADVAATVEAALDDAEIDLENGILTITVGDDVRFVLNKHGPNREVWLASPRSGAWHFAWDAGHGAWVDRRGGGETLAAILGRDLTEAAGRPVALE